MLFDTHVLIWLGTQPERLPRNLIAEIDQSEEPPIYSAVSIWEVAIKHARGRSDFDYDPALLTRRLDEAGWMQLTLDARHAAAAGALPPVHSDPFDRALVGQAQIEGLTPVTSDAILQRYPAPIRLI